MTDDNPFAAPGQFFKGNLHTHSTRSDGLEPPEAVAGHYRRAGYDFIAMTDHFEARYDWPITRVDGGTDRDFLVLPGAELHAPANSLGEPWHIVAVGLPPDFTPPADGETGTDLAQRAADAGAFIGLAHPTASGLAVADGHALSCAHAVEIYNHAAHVGSDRADGWYLCTALLNEGRRVGAFAADDAHFKGRDHLGGWVHVRATELSQAALVDALKASRYYSSQGPTIDDLRIEHDRVTITSSPVERVIVSGRGAKALVVRDKDLERAEVDIRRLPSPYIRVTLVDHHGRKAWTNALWR